MSAIDTNESRKFKPLTALARDTKISPRSLRRLCAKAGIPIYRLGPNTARIEERDFERLLAQHVEPPMSGAA